MKKFLTLFLTFLIAFAPVSVSASAKFKDVPSSYWAASHISEANDLGIIYGYNNGKFEPQMNVKKQEAFVMIFRIMKIAGILDLSDYIPVPAPEDENPFEAESQVPAPEDEIADQIEENTSLMETGGNGTETVQEEFVRFVSDIDPDSEEGIALLDRYVDTWAEVLDACDFSNNAGMRRAAAYGFQYGICEPADFAAGAKTEASRELIAKWSCSAFKYDKAPAALLPYMDAQDIGAECIDAVDALYRHGIMVGGTDGKFNPKKGIIRAEIAAIAVRMLKDIQSDRELTLDNALLNLYGEIISINYETGLFTMQTADGIKYLRISPDAQVYFDAVACDFWNLDITGKKVTVSALSGSDRFVFSTCIQSGAGVQSGTVMGNVLQFSDFYAVTVLQSGGVSNTFVYTDKTLGRLPVSGSYITFIADGLELLEVK